MTGDARDVPHCPVIRTGVPFIGKQGLVYAAAIAAETVGARSIHMYIPANVPHLPYNRSKT